MKFTREQLECGETAFYDCSQTFLSEFEGASPDLYPEGRQ